jgi:D-3-phosphoglycerate dehydrogenase / 2-oxoglutarate reductase
MMGDQNSTLDNLILDLLDWLTPDGRSYEDVLDAWRTSCPRLPVWEEANERGLVVRVEAHDRSVILPTAAGLALVEQRREPAGTAAHTVLPHDTQPG